MDKIVACNFLGSVFSSLFMVKHSVLYYCICFSSCNFYLLKMLSLHVLRGIKRQFNCHYNFLFFFSFDMLVFFTIAVTFTVTNGEDLCLDADNQTVNCPGEGYTTIPELPTGAIRV